ncbi:MAG TPA: 3-dehydroquinate synthase II [Methanoregulaceae archaeon]|nr:3-dehydroquinate synthase II [Methanoregulaceae archaeon]
MKEIWVDIRPWRKELATTAIESGADAIMTEDAAAVKSLGRIRVIAPDGDLQPGRDVFEVEISDKETEEEALRLSGKGYVIVYAADWSVIPLENLVAQSEKIIAAVGSEEDAEVALHVLEKGVAGILLKTDDPAVIRRVAAMVKKPGQIAHLTPFTITTIRNVGMGDRVCVDSCTMMVEGEGMLVGNTSSAFFLIHAETLENPYVAPRPFRVNAGAVHAYILTTGGKTAYLSDLRSGDQVQVTDAEGNVRDAAVGRIKIESRPMLLIEGEFKGQKASIILQNAETIRLLKEDKSAVSVVDLSVGDRVLGCSMEAGRHFGIAVKEKIIEK